MNKNIITKNKKIEYLNEEKNSNLLFAFAAILNIFGIQTEQNELTNNNDSFKSKTIYLIVLFIAFYIYKDIFKRDIIEYNHAINNSEPLFSYSIKLIGNIFFIIGIILFIISEITQASSFPPEI